MANVKKILHYIYNSIHNGVDVKLRALLALLNATRLWRFTPSYACTCAIKDCFVPSLRSVTTVLTLSYVLSLPLPSQR